MRVANSDAWDNRAAADAYHNAIGKQSNIDIVTPSKGDVPLWANTELGGTLLQFKKVWYSFYTTNVIKRFTRKRCKLLPGRIIINGSWSYGRCI